jgi:hypothetical protein
LRRTIPIRAPAGRSKTTGSRARTPVEDDPELFTGETSTWKEPGRRAPGKHRLEDNRTGGPAAHPETTGSRARTPVQDDPELSTGETSTWKEPGRRAPGKYRLEDNRTGGPAAHPETTGSRARTPVEDDPDLSTGETSTWKEPSCRALENIDSKNTGRVARQPAVTALLGVTVLICLTLAGMTVSSQGLIPHRVAGDIHVTAPTLHFLTGKALSRLHDGATVPFDFQLIITSGSKTNVVARALERFTVSYDVWEEKFSVVRMRDLHRSSLRMSSSGAESWCLDHIVIPAAGLPAGQQLWARLEIRSVESKEPLDAASGINLATLIEIFSRPSRPQQDRWSIESVPFQLADLKPDPKPSDAR